MSAKCIQADIKSECQRSLREELPTIKRSQYEVDLHIHSTYSDGSFTPREIVELAMHKGLKAIAIADHDTVEGVAEAVAAGEERGIEVVPAVELSIKNEQEKDFVELHLLGYFIDHQDEEFNDVLDRIVQARIEQKIRQIKVLQDDGIDVSVEEVFSLVRAVPGRPHIAEVVMRRNPDRFVSKEELFAEYLTVGGKAYTKRSFSLTLAEAIQVVVKAGGLPVLAHPGVYDKVKDIEAMICRAQGIGLQGLEVAYTYNKNRPHHGLAAAEMQALLARFEALADELGLVKTGGSDFHGEGKDIELGEMGMNYVEFQELKAKSSFIGTLSQS
jgi:predicted metal-dependent phosphoesterase TrpH